MQERIQSFYERYGPMVFRRCLSLLRDEERAMDAMQETFVLLLQNEARLDLSRPSGLLLRMATNHCLNLLRSQRRRPEDPLDALVHQIAAADDPESRSPSEADGTGRLRHPAPDGYRIRERPDRMLQCDRK